MDFSKLLKSALDTKTFRFQFIATLAVLWLVQLISSTFNCVISVLGISFLLLIASWKLTKLIRKQYFREKLSPKNKGVLVTGCDSGFGHSLAKRLSRDGYTVFAGCYDISGPGPQELLKTASIQRGLKLIPLDVTNDIQVQEALQLVSSSLSKDGVKLWAIVNNAGIAKNALVEWGTLDDYQKIFDVNVIGLARVTRAFLPLLRKSKGRVINMSSLAGVIASPAMAIYAMSKHAVRAFNTALRREMAPWGVKVSLIEPAGYKTAMTDTGVFEKEMKKMWSETPDQIRKDYGEICFNFTLKFFEMNPHTRDPEEVVDVIMDAIGDIEPEVAYGVYGWRFTVIRYLNDYLPEALFDKFGARRSPPGPEIKYL